MDRYFIELTRRLLKLGLKTVCEENEKQLTVIHQGKELCRVDDENGMSHFPLNITTAEKENLLDKVCDLSSQDFTIKASDGWHCLLVLPKEGTDGTLIESEGYGYSRYFSFLPNARLLIESQKQIQDYQKIQTVTTGEKFYCPLTIKKYMSVEERLMVNT